MECTFIIFVDCSIGSTFATKRYALNLVYKQAIILSSSAAPFGQRSKCAQEKACSRNEERQP